MQTEYFWEPAGVPYLPVILPAIIRIRIRIMMRTSLEYVLDKSEDEEVDFVFNNQTNKLLPQFSLHMSRLPRTLPSIDINILEHLTSTHCACGPI